MSMESTITEFEMDAESRQMINNLRAGGSESDMDLDVDGLSDSILARFRRFFAFGRH